MTTLLLAYSIIHDFLITAAIRNGGEGGGGGNYICGWLAGWRAGAADSEERFGGDSWRNNSLPLYCVACDECGPREDEPRAGEGGRRGQGCSSKDR